MNNEEILRLVIDILSSPRDRLRRLEVDHTLRARAYAALRGKAPNGGLDELDQCLMLLQSAVGDKIQSTLDIKRKAG